MPLLSRLMGLPSSRKTSRPTRPTLEPLEDRALPSGFSAIQANFNATRIPAGDTVWIHVVTDQREGTGRDPTLSHQVGRAVPGRCR